MRLKRALFCHECWLELRLLTSTIAVATDVRYASDSRARADIAGGPPRPAILHERLAVNGTAPALSPPNPKASELLSFRPPGLARAAVFDVDFPASRRAHC